MAPRKDEDFVIGIDFGTDSVRAVVTDVSDGSFAGTAVRAYKRWSEGRYCAPRDNCFRQHPLDYVEGMEGAILAALDAAEKKLGHRPSSQVRAISVDTTGSTPSFADAAGRPLALDPEFAENPDAMFVLWKDHTAVAEAALINGLARTWGGENYTKYEGGIYSSEWFWAKVLHLVKSAPLVAQRAVTVIEHCDWMPALLTGQTAHRAIRRSRCAMGHKAMWHASWGGYPSEEFLFRLHPRLAELVPSLGKETFDAAEKAGYLCAEWAKRLGLSGEVVVAVGAYDAHIGAVGGDVAPGTLLKIMGTSTCDIMVGPRPKGPETLVAGICGQVDGSVIPGWIGYEAGQSAFGDLFAWFRDLLSWPLREIPGIMPKGNGDGGEIARRALEDVILPSLEKAAAELEPGSGGLVALDWLNGRRTPDANQGLTGAIVGLTLGTDAPALYRSFVEAAAFGSRAIVDRLRSQGLVIEAVAAVGGVAKKSPLAMQISADVLGMPISVSASDQSCALGASMFAATAAGLYPDVLKAQEAMRSPTERVYKPDPKNRAAYDLIYQKYLELGAFVEKTGAAQGASE